eukprot:2124468-Rhodomonas_salina.1
MSAQQTIRESQGGCDGREKELQAIEAEKEIATKDEELRVARITVQTALKDKEETIVLEEHKTAYLPPTPLVASFLLDVFCVAFAY